MSLLALLFALVDAISERIISRACDISFGDEEVA